MRGALIMAAMLVGGVMPAAAQETPVEAEEPTITIKGFRTGPVSGGGPKGDSRAYDGRCESGSEVAGTPFTCRTMIRSQFDIMSTEVILFFTQRSDEGGQSLGLGGRMRAGGIIVIDSVQLSGAFFPATGTCLLTRKRGKIKTVNCTATETGGSGRIVRIIFTVASLLRP